MNTILLSLVLMQVPPTAPPVTTTAPTVGQFAAKNQELLNRTTQIQAKLKAQRTRMTQDLVRPNQGRLIASTTAPATTAPPAVVGGGDVIVQSPPAPPPVIIQQPPATTCAPPVGVRSRVCFDLPQGPPGPQGPQGPPGATPQIDYDRLAQLLAGMVYFDVVLVDDAGNVLATKRISNQGQLIIKESNIGIR